MGPRLGGQAELACPGDGLGAVGRAELAEDVADVLVNRIHGDHQLFGAARVRRARGQQRQDGPPSGLGDQSELAGLGDGLGAVGRPQLAQDVADVLFDGVEGDHQLPGDARVRRAGGQQRQHLQFAGG